MFDEAMYPHIVPQKGEPTRLVSLDDHLKKTLRGRTIQEIAEYCTRFLIPACRNQVSVADAIQNLKNP